MTRPLAGSIIVMNPTKLAEMGIQQTASNRTDTYEVPGKDKISNMTSEEIARITSLIGESYTPSTLEETAESKSAETKTATAPSNAPKAKPTSPKATLNSLTEEQEEEVDEAVAVGENSSESSAVNQESEVVAINTNNNDLPRIPGYGFYIHTGLNENTVRHSGSKLDLDGLGPHSGRITSEALKGFKTFQKIVALYPDTSSEEFKEAMQDPSVLAFFYWANPELASTHGDTDDDREARNLEIYEALVTDGQLTIDKSDYIFGKRFEPGFDESRHLNSDPSKSLPKDSLFLMFGRRFQVRNAAKEVKIDQYISMGCFPSDDNARKEKNPSALSAYEKVAKLIDGDLQKPATRLAVLKLDAKEGRIQPRYGLQIKSQDKSQEYRHSLNTLKQQGLYFNLNKIGIITDAKNSNDEFIFLRYIADYESGNLNPALTEAEKARAQKQSDEKYQKLRSIYVVRDDLNVETLSVKGHYFTTVSYTAADDPKYSRVVILDAAPIFWDAAVKHILNEDKKSKSAGRKDSSHFVEKLQTLSPLSQAKLVTAILEQVGCFNEETKDVQLADGTKVPRAKLYLERALEALQKLKSGKYVAEARAAEEALNDSQFGYSQQEVLDFLKKQKVFGIFFVTDLIHIKEGTEETKFYINDLASEDAENPTPIELALNGVDQYGYMNFKVEKESEDFPGDYKFFVARCFTTPESSWQALNFLVLANHSITMPIFNLTPDVLNTATSVTGTKLETVDIDFKTAKEAKEAAKVAGLGWKELAEGLDSTKVNWHQPKGVVDLDKPTVKYDVRKKRFISARSHIQNKYKIDIVHVHGDAFSVMTYICLRRIHFKRVIAHSHNTNQPAKFLLPIKKLITTKLSAYHFACSLEAGEWLFGKKMVKKTNFSIVNNASDVKNFSFSALSRDLIRKKYSISNDKIVIGCVGHLVDNHKNQSFLIKMLSSIDIGNKYLLFLIGNGNDYNQLLEFAKKLNVENKVIFERNVNNTSMYYSAFDSFCLPSHYEGLGIVCVEAIASGLTPIISIHVPTIPELASFETKLGIADSDFLNWQKAIDSTVRNAKLNTIVEQSGYSIKNASRRLLELYKTVLGDTHE